MIFDEENATLWIGKLKLMSWKHRSKNQNKNLNRFETT